MSIVPERFEIPQAQKFAVAVLAAVMLGASAGAAYFAWYGIGGSRDPHGDLIALSAMAGMFALIGTVAAREARRVWNSAITLRDGGLELDGGESAPTFIGWGQIGGLSLRSLRGGIGVLGLGGETLLTVETRLTGVGRLLYAILSNAVLPKRSPILPYHTETRSPKVLLPMLLVGFSAMAGVIFLNAPPEAQRAALLSLVAAAVAVAAVVWGVGRFGQLRSLSVDANGITIEQGRGATTRRWSDLRGASLIFVRGPKGQLFPRLGLQGNDGRWEPLLLQGTDLVELLAAINAAAPGKVIAPPDAPIIPSRRLFAAKFVGGR